MKRMLSKREGTSGDILLSQTRFVEFGSDAVEMIPLAAINDLRQVRSGYDPEELRDLADRIPYEITDDLNVRFNLVNPPTVAAYDSPIDVAEFLQQHALYYGSEVTLAPDDLRTWNGTWYIRVNGHRRGLASEMRCHELGIDSSDPKVQTSCTILESPTFDEARRQQYIENTSAPITPVDDAEAIKREYDYRINHQGAGAQVQSKVIMDVAEFFGYGREKIKAALLFVELPKRVKESVGAKTITYSQAVLLAQVEGAYRGLYGDEAQARMLDFFDIHVLNRLRGAKKSIATGIIEAKLREIRDSGYKIDELFLIDEPTERKKATRQVGRDIAKTAVFALKYTDPSSLTDEDIVTLQAVLEQAAVRASRVETTDEQQLF